MSYQYTTTSNQGGPRLTEFVPTYVTKSDYLPSRVIETNQNEANQWVSIDLTLACHLLAAKEKRTRLLPETRRV